MSGSNSVCWGQGGQENRKYSMKRLSQQTRQSESHAICDVCLPKRNLQLFTQSKLKKVTELYPPSLKKLVRKDLICYELDNLQFCNNKILIHVEHNFHDTITKALTAKICFSSILEGSFSRTKQKLNFTYQDSLSLFYFSYLYLHY